MANRACNLECVKHKAQEEVIEFIGPVKIVLVDQPPNIYRRRVWGAGFIVLAQMMIGATVMTVFFYALSYRDKFNLVLHIFFCTAGFQLCIPSGILSMNKQSGSSAPMRLPHRKFEHVFLQVTGFSLALSASVLMLLDSFKKSVNFYSLTVHAFIGVVATGLSVFAVLTGLIVYGCLAAPTFLERFGKVSLIFNAIHKTIGSLAFISSSVCFIFGLWRPSFEAWVPLPQMIKILLFFCVFYTLIIVYRPVMKIVSSFF